jgi:hypothetical protein
MRIDLSFVVALSLAAYSSLLAGETTMLMGRVVPTPGSLVVAKNVWVGAVAAPVAADGSFRAAGIPGGPTEIAIETSGGLYRVATPIAIAPGTTRQVQLAFGGRQDTSPPPAEKAKPKKQGGVWSNPAYATLIVVGSAIVLGVAIDQLTTSSSNQTPASPSAPAN